MKAHKYFGTDGVRGKANSYPMTAEIAMRVGMAAGLEFCQGKTHPKVVIAKDTRLSGYMIESALTAGFTSVGANVMLLGPLPTPAVSMLTRSMRADVGVMISASHNPHYDNGIKLFGGDGNKLSDEIERRIESYMDSDMSKKLANPADIGRAKRIDDARGRYIEFVKQSFPKDLNLDKLRIVIDSANGAAYHIAPLVLRELGAEIITIGDSPNGFNINENCGSTSPNLMCKTVLDMKADLGIALDGDADRLIICDEQGKILDGDKIMAIIAVYLQENNRLSAPMIVATKMSNFAFEKFLTSKNIKLIRSNVGDKYVLQEMQKNNCNFGGEQSGHIIMLDYSTTGDGLISALQILALKSRKKQKMSEIANIFTPMPQILLNIKINNDEKNPLEVESIIKYIADCKQILGNEGRIFIRKSGTEAKIRVMVEGKDKQKIHKIANDICDKITSI